MTSKNWTSYTVNFVKSAISRIQTIWRQIRLFNSYRSGSPILLYEVKRLSYILSPVLVLVFASYFHDIWGHIGQKIQEVRWINLIIPRGNTRIHGIRVRSIKVGPESHFSRATTRYLHVVCIYGAICLQILFLNIISCCFAMKCWHFLHKSVYNKSRINILCRLLFTVFGLVQPGPAAAWLK